MNNKFLFTIVIAFASVACSNSPGVKQSNQQNEGEMIAKNSQSDGILEIINKVPISQLPLGIKNLDSIETINLADFGAYNVPIDYEVDVNNNYQLNDFFRESLGLRKYDWNLKNLGVSMVPVDSVKLYFSKRLPPRGNRNYFLCKVVQTINSRANSFTGWVLLTMSGEHVVDRIQVAQGSEQEDVYRRYAIFYMDENYHITINTYIANSRYKPTTIAALYGKQSYYLSEEDNSFYLDIEEVVEPEFGDEGEYEEYDEE